MEAVEDPPSTVHWKQGVLDTLQSLSSTSPPDCCIIVGNLEVGEKDLKIVYKFAKCYSVQWIMDFLRPMFVDYLRKDESCERFIEVMKFAESIWCTDLSNACCELLNSEMINKISQPEVLSQMNVFMMKSITSYEKLATPEKDIFGLVVDWINAKLSCASQDLSSILENIQYNLIESEYLFDVVFDFILNLKNVVDSTKRSILMRVKGSMKQSSEQSSRRTRFMKKTIPPKDVFKLIPSVKLFSSSNDECLQKIDLWMKGETKLGEKNIRISKKEVSSVIYDKFKFMAESDKNTFAMYLSTNKDMALKFIDQLLLLHNTFPSPLFVRLFLGLCLDSDGENYQRLYQVPWNLVSYQTVSLIVTTSTILEELLEFDCKNEFKNNSRSSNLNRYSKYSERFEGCGQIEFIMLWALANTTQESQIKELLKSVCFRKVPSKYLDMNYKIPCVLLLLSLSLYYLLSPAPPLTTEQLSSHLNNKVVLICGASSGIGAELAHQLAPLGAKIVLVARSQDKLDAVKEGAVKLGAVEADVKTIAFDFSDVKGSGAVIDQTIAWFGKLDYLVSNHAAIVNGPFLGESPVYQVAIYSSTKHALNGFFYSLQQELIAKESPVSLTVGVLGLINTKEVTHMIAKEQNPAGTSESTEIPGSGSVEECARRIIECYVTRPLTMTFPKFVPNINRLMWFMLPCYHDTLISATKPPGSEGTGYQEYLDTLPRLREMARKLNYQQGYGGGNVDQ
ncbi:hypothetical protein ACHWQZ_G013190 [Mnemiopsis leidyi]